jgi:TolB-like protein/tetratricopeptide (TPR) repeat protein/DNA-binding winged helix-turn-helix (wHTH) protein
MASETTYSPAEAISPVVGAIRNTRRFQFGLFELDLRAGELRKQGIRIKLQEKPLHLLLLLLERAGRTATREELRNGLWPADTFVDFDANLKTTLNKLRQALGDSAENPIFIETIPRHGYRFLAPVTRVFDDSVSGSAGSAAVSETVQVPSAAPKTTAEHWRWGVAGALAMIAIATAIYGLRFRPAPAAASGAKPIVLLVLPFDNLSGDATQEFFSDGLTDEMITLLGGHSPRGLAVIARTSAMRYKGTREPLPQLARELGGVDYVLEGSVRRSGKQVGINAQLFRTGDQTSLWTETYESELTDILTIQKDVAGRIAQSLLLRLVPSPAANGATAVDPKAYDEYLMGRYEANHRTAEGLTKSFVYYQRAIRDDPGYAPAYAGMADSYLLSAGWLTLKPSQAYPKAKEAALRALQLDANLAEAHATLAEVEHEYNWKWSDAEREFRRAIELNPNSAMAHKSYAEFLMHGGRNAEAIVEIEKAKDLDPLSLAVSSLAGFVYFYAGDYDRAVQECEKILQLDPNFAPAHYFLGATLLQKKRYDEAIQQFQAAHDLTQGGSLMTAGLARAYAVAGRRPQAEWALAELKKNAGRSYVSPYGLAQVYAELGDKDRALTILERAADEHAFEMIFLNIDRSFHGLHGQPRFQALIKRIGFPPGTAPARD